MAGRPSARALRVWPRRAGLVLGCAAVLILAATAGYDGIVRFLLWRDYNRKVQEFQAKGPLLQEAFPLNLGNHLVPPPPHGFDEEVYRISNFHEAELMLRSLGCDDRGIQRAMALFLAASTPEYNNKTLTFEVATPGQKGKDCLREDIFDQVAAEAGAAAKAPSATQKASPKVTWDDETAQPPPPGFTLDKPPARSRTPSVPLAHDSERFRTSSTPPSPHDESYWTAKPPKGRQPSQLGDDEVEFVRETREVAFDFRIEDSDVTRGFFAPLPDWYAEALQHKIKVASVPDWMKPGEPPSSWSFTGWLGSRSSVLILAAGMLAVSVLCFVVAGRIDRTTTIAENGAGGVRSDQGVL